MATNYSEGQYVPGKGIALPIEGSFREPTATELQKLFPNADPDLIKLYSAGIFNKTTSNIPEELKYGASGRGEDPYNPIIEEGIKKGVPTSELGNYSQDPKGYKIPLVGQFEAAGIAKTYGLSGLNIENKLIGLSTKDALELAQKENIKRRGQVSSMTSYGYDPKSIAGFKDIYQDLKFKVDENKNNAWLDKLTKKQQQESIINSYTNDFSKLFQTQDQFNSALQDPEFQRLINDYEKIGGSRNAIAANIGSQVSNVTNDQEAQSLGYQTLDQYLGAMDTKSKQMAIESLIPEKKIVQDQIAFEQSIPEAYKQYYFGSEEQIGLLQRQKLEAEETIKLIEKRAKSEERNAKAQADLLLERNNIELAKTEAEIEENRLTARNYLVGQLAKLGALKTTGKAPEAIANLEQKYQRQAQQLKTTYQLENQGLKIKLQESLDKIDLGRSEDILKIKQDLTKNEEDVWKEIFKLEQTAERESFKLIDNFARDFRSRNDKYSTELKKEAEKYAKELYSNASLFDVSKFREGDFVFNTDKKGKRIDVGILSPTGDVRTIDQILELSKGPDGYVNSDTYRQMFERYTASGGTRSKFLSLYPPTKYVNPKDNSLPSFLKFGSSARAESKDSAQDEIDVEAWLNS